MRILLFACAALFALLHAFAAAVHIKTAQNKANDCLMIAGACLALAGAALCLLNIRFDWLFACIGLIMIVFSAIQNGRSGSFHIRHHIVRIALCALLVLGFILV